MGCGFARPEKPEDPICAHCRDEPGVNVYYGSKYCDKCYDQLQGGRRKKENQFEYQLAKVRGEVVEEEEIEKKNAEIKPVTRKGKEKARDSSSSSSSEDEREAPPPEATEPPKPKRKAPPPAPPPKKLKPAPAPPPKRLKNKDT